MMKKIALAAVLGLAGFSVAFAEETPAPPAGGQRPGMEQRMEKMMQRRQEKMEDRADIQEKRIAEMCKRGEEEVARMTERKLPAELISLVDSQQKERCEMDKRHFAARQALLEKLRAEKKMPAQEQVGAPTDSTP